MGDWINYNTVTYKQIVLVILYMGRSAAANTFLEGRLRFAGRMLINPVLYESNLKNIS